jgi:hypothetical protein
MKTFVANLEAQVQQKGTYKIPDELNEAYILYRTGWSFDQLRATPAHVIEELKFLWHLENMQRDYEQRQTK